MFPVTVIGNPPALDKTIKVQSASEQNSYWKVAEETPVAFVYNRRNYAVMLATPHDLVDYAIGFSLTEEVIESPDDIVELDIIYTDRGVDLRIQLNDHCLEKMDVKQRRRALVGNAGCGVCGLESVDSLFQKLPRVAERSADIAVQTISQAMSNLARYQIMNQKTRSVHGAAWVDQRSGNIQHIREDVGRHNALDKLIGLLAQSKANVAEGFVLITSRCSYEIVEKAAKFKIGAIASISAPTGFALQKANEAGIMLYAKGQDGPVGFAS